MRIDDSDKSRDYSDELLTRITVISIKNHRNHYTQVFNAL